MSGSVTGRHGSKHFARAIKSGVYIHILGTNVYWVCSTHLAQLVMTPLVVMTAAHVIGDMPFFNPLVPKRHLLPLSARMSTSDVTQFELACSEGLRNGQLFLHLIILVPTVQSPHVRFLNYPNVLRQASLLAVNSDSW